MRAYELSDVVEGFFPSSGFKEGCLSASADHSTKLRNFAAAKEEVGDLGGLFALSGSFFSAHMSFSPREAASGAEVL